MMDNSNSSPREVNRDRGRRGERTSRFSDANNSGGNNNNDRERSRDSRPTNRIYVSNIPYEFRWQDLKDLCRQQVGDVTFVEMFNDESGKPRGCGIVEFKDTNCVVLAMEKLNRHEINGRHLVIKEDHGDLRDSFGRVIRGGGGGDRGGMGRGDRGGDRDRDNSQSNNRMSQGGGGGFGGRDRDDDRWIIFFYYLWSFFPSTQHHYQPTTRIAVNFCPIIPLIYLLFLFSIRVS